MSTTTPQRPSYLDTLDCVITETIAPLAVETDQAGAYPRAAVEALGKAGLLGLISAQDVGGLGEAHRTATLVIEEIGKYCASTAMIVCMHYAGTAVIEAYGPREVREAIAAGQHVTTLAAGTTRMLTRTLLLTTVTSQLCQQLPPNWSPFFNRCSSICLMMTRRFDLCAIWRDYKRGTQEEEMATKPLRRL